jgi:ribosome maturation factor RimP
MEKIAALTENLIKNVIEAEGLELVHVEYRPQGGSQLLRVLIDKEEGVNLSDCAEISRQLSVLLDVEDLIPDSYVLEVSSPGLERPLFTKEDYQRFAGREIRLVATEKIEARRNFTGHIRDFADGVLNLDCDGKLYAIPSEKIKKANLVYRFN